MDVTSPVFMPIFLSVPPFETISGVVHANLGFQQEKVPRQITLTWEVGTEVALSRDLYAIGETYGDNRWNSFWQVGLRYWLMPGKVQVDATRGGETNGGGSWFSVGIRLIGDGLFDQALPLSKGTLTVKIAPPSLLRTEIRPPMLFSMMVFDM